jgi:hypothetical protein
VTKCVFKALYELLEKKKTNKQKNTNLYVKNNLNVFYLNLKINLYVKSNFWV